MTHDGSLDPQFRARLRGELARGVHADATHTSKARRRRAGLIASTGTVVLAVGVFGVLGFQTATSAPEEQPTAESLTVLCAEGVSFPEGQSVLDGIETIVESGGDTDARMLAACAELWEDGTLTNRIELQISQSGPQVPAPVPQLTLCTLPDGAYVGVPFTCEELEALLSVVEDSQPEEKS
ncbi:hypothetical protein [Microbacterium sp. A84]|uniref:hypothetical protein n=1 Tax=Microbacterium sp. A84 TaxID=3450715 RepID=UPI003F41F3DD